MNVYLPVVVLAMTTVIQVTLLPRFTIGGIHPDLVLLVVVAWGLIRGPSEGGVWGFIGGLLLDLYSVAPFGVFTLALILIGFLAGAGESALFRQNIVLPLLAAAIATLLFYSLTSAALAVVGWPVEWGRTLPRVLIAGTLFNTTLMPFVFPIARGLARMFEPRQVSWP